MVYFEDRIVNQLVFGLCMLEPLVLKLHGWDAVGSARAACAVVDRSFIVIVGLEFD